MFSLLATAVSVFGFSPAFLVYLQGFVPAAASSGGGSSGLSSLTDVAATLVTFFGSIISALFGSSGAWTALLPYFLLGIGASLCLLGVKMIRKIVWGS